MKKLDLENEELGLFYELPALEFLELFNCHNITDVSSLINCRALKNLSLNSRHIISGLDKLQQVRHLQVSWLHVNLGELVKMIYLETLELSDVVFDSISDLLDLLHALPQLKHVRFKTVDPQFPRKFDSFPNIEFFVS